MKYWDSLQTIVLERFTLYVSVLPILIEIIGIILCFTFANAIIFHGIRIKHTATLLKEGPFSQPAGIHREKPREHYAKKFFQNQHGLWIHYCSWKNEGLNPIGVAVILHGHSEHINRHAHVAEELADAGLYVFGIDHQGFGRSEGDRAHVEKFEHYVDDITLFFQDVLLKLYPDLAELPKFIMGHSMGGLITISTALRFQDLSNLSLNPKWLEISDKKRKKLYNLQGIIVSAPALGIGMDFNFITRGFFNQIAFFFPKSKFFNFPSSPSTTFLQAKMHSMLDPLNYNEPLRPHHTSELIKGSEKTRKEMVNFTTPVFIFHGNQDTVVNIKTTKEFLIQIKTPKKDIKYVELENKGHEPLQDEREVRDKLIKSIIEWINGRV